MKVAMVIEQFDVARGGQERSTFEIAELLAKRGMDVLILTAQSGGLPAGAKCRLTDLQIRCPSRTGRFRRFVQQAGEYLRRDRVDVIHAITPIPDAQVYQPRGGLIQETYLRSLSRYNGIKKVIRRMIGPNARQREVRRVEEFLAKKTDCRFLAVSDYVRRQCVEHLQLADDRIEVIFNGVDLDRLPAVSEITERNEHRAALKIREDQLAGIFLATNFKLKGLDVIVEAAGVLKEKYCEHLEKFRFIIAGPDNIQPYHKRISAMELAENFIFFGQADDVSAMLRMSDFLIHPTWYDPCSRVVLEAMACGLPAISTRFNGASELLRERDCGLVVDDPADPEEMAENWIKLMDAELRVHFSKNATAMRSRIGMDYHVEQLMNFYHTFLKDR
ncbi:MAG: glycosyltransferase family 4 protein [Phycisphaerae bacterium]|nr:glycosyltransferase family 4 protein [Phycisphaerae bacterium]